MKKLLMSAAVALLLLPTLSAQDKPAAKAAVSPVPADFQVKYWKLVAEQLAADVTLTKRTEAIKAEHAAEVDRVSKEFKTLTAEAGAKLGCIVISVKDGLACQEKK